MDQKQAFRQMIEFNKSLFENSFSTMAMLQDQAEKFGYMLLDQATWLPNEGKKVADEWMQACRKGRETFKKAMDDGFSKAESFLSES